MATIFITDADDEMGVLVSGLPKLSFRKIVVAVLPLIEQNLGQDKALETSGVADGLEMLDLVDLSAELFNKVCMAIKQTINQYNELAPYAQEILQKMQYDPRYTATA